MFRSFALPLLLTACLFSRAMADDAAPPICKKLVVIGDSITKHLPAVEKLDWTGYWGMAASSEDKDYVHLIRASMMAAQNGQAPQMLIEGGGGGKLEDKTQYFPEIKAFGADVAIVQMGENDTHPTAESFQKQYETILKALHESNPDIRIYCFGTWAPPNGDPTKDDMIVEACRHQHATFIDMVVANSEVTNKSESEGRSTNVGVNWHPGDKGMQAYADAFWAAYTGKSVPAIPAPNPPGPVTGTILTENWDLLSGVDWSPKPTVQATDGHQTLTATLTKANDRVFFSAFLPVDKINGHFIQIKTRVKGTNISTKPNGWNGVRIGLKLQNAEGQVTYPQTSLPDGTFDWKDVSWDFQVPSNIVTAQLILGLENVTGTVSFDALKVSVQP